MNNNYFSPVIVKYQEKHLVIVNIACQSLSLSLYQGFTVSTTTKACVQSFSPKGVQPSFGRPFLEEIQGKFTLSLIILWENKPSGKPVFNVWLRACMCDLQNHYLKTQRVREQNCCK